MSKIYTVKAHVPYTFHVDAEEEKLPDNLTDEQVIGHVWEQLYNGYMELDEHMGDVIRGLVFDEVTS